VEALGEDQIGEEDRQEERPDDGRHAAPPLLDEAPPAYPAQDGMVSVPPRDVRLVRANGTARAGKLLVAADKRKPVPFDVDALIRRQITLRGVRGHSFAAVEMALGLMAQHTVDLEAMSTHEFDLGQVDYALRLVGGEMQEQAIHVTVPLSERELQAKFVDCSLGALGANQATELFSSLMRLEEPYSYRDRFTMPKLIMNSAGDQYFLPDSSQFYFDDLPGEKYLRYVPNTNHSMANSDARESLIAFYDAVLRGQPRPKFFWKFEKNGDIKGTSVDKPQEV